MRSSFQRALLACAVLAISPQVAAAPDDTAVASVDAELQAGRALRSKGDLAGAAARFKASFKATRSAVAGYELAVTLRMLGDLIGAYDVLVDVGELEPTAADEIAAQNSGAELIEKLEKLIPTITLDLSVVAADVAKVVVDDEELPPARWKKPIALNPGKHAVVVHFKDGRKLKKSFEITAKARATIPITAPTDDATSPEDEPPPPPCPAGTHAVDRDCVKTVGSYPGQVVVADAAVGVLFTAGAAADSVPLAVVGIIGLPFAAATVHWAHGRVGRGFASFGLHSGAFLASVFATAGVAGDDGPSRTGLAVMFLAGTAGGLALDMLVLSHSIEEVVPRTAATLRPTIGFTPIRGGVAGSLHFAF